MPMGPFGVDPLLTVLSSSHFSATDYLKCCLILIRVKGHQDLPQQTLEDRAGIHPRQVASPFHGTCSCFWTVGVNWRKTTSTGKAHKLCI